jgi:hypothetical protein
MVAPDQGAGLVAWPRDEEGTTRDPYFRFLAHPVSDTEAYIVRGRTLGPLVEISLGRESKHKRRFGADSYTPIELLALKRFRHGELAAYAAYAGNLDVAAGIAVRGELGYTVRVAAEDGKVRISIVARLLAPDGRVHTDISHDHTFEDPDSGLALVQANEKATELRAIAEQLNDHWVTVRRAHLLDLRAGYDKADAEAESANELRRIVDAEDA